MRVRNLFTMIVIFLLLNSCAKEESKSTSNDSDTQAPSLSEVTSITTPTNDNTPNYTFSSSEAGTITYGGSCSSGTTSAASGNNTITLYSLSDGTYSDCTIKVTDSSGNESSLLTISEFVIDTAGPTLAEVTAVTTPSNDSTPNYTFSSSKAGTITYSGSCSSSTTSAVSGNNLITLNLLNDGTYSDCKIKVTDNLSNESNNLIISEFIIDSTAPSLLEVTAIATPTNDNTPDYTFSSSEVGIITYGGPCSSGTTSAVSGNNTVTLNTLNDGTYSSCTISVRDNSSNTSVTLNISSFIVDTTSPTVISTSGVDNSSTNTTSVSATFSELIDNFTITSTTFKITDASNNSVSGNLTISDNGSNTTVTYSPNSDFNKSTNYSLTLSTGIADISGNQLESQKIITFNIPPPWIRQLGSSAYETVARVASDPSGNIYVGGTTQGDLDGNTNAGSWSQDIYLLKYNSSGTKQWTIQLGTSSAEGVAGIVTDSSGNIYVAGSTQGALGGNSNAGDWDIYLIKYNSSGTSQWINQFGSSARDQPWNGIAIDSSNNIYVTGYTAGGLDSNTSSGGNDAFLVKFDSLGTKQWTSQWGTSSNDNGLVVAVDSSGNIYVSGETLGALEGSNQGSTDVFLSKFNTSGNLQWTRQLGSDQADYSKSIAVDSSDNIYITGYTAGDFDGNTFVVGGPYDYFLVKYNTSGAKQWSKLFGDNSKDIANGITTDSSGNIYITGNTSGSLGGFSNQGQEDYFLQKLDSSGNELWYKQSGFSKNDYGMSVEIDSSGNIFVAGQTWMAFDGYTQAGNGDLFVIKYDSNGNIQ